MFSDSSRELNQDILVLFPPQFQIEQTQTPLVNNKPAQTDNIMTLRRVQHRSMVLHSQSEIRRGV